MENTKRAGSIIELQVMSELLKYGEVSIPYGNGARYDCILDLNGKLVKIQIKTAKRLDDNRFSVPFANKRIGTTKTVRKVYTTEDVDYIATYYEGALYVLPTGKHVNEMTLSFNYPKNGIKSTIHLAKNYRGEVVFGTTRVEEQLNIAS